MEPSDHLLLQHIRELEDSLNVPLGFLVSLPRETDWSFIVKLHALIEAALTQVIVAAVANDELAEPVRRLNVRGPAGKVAFARALGLVDDKHNPFLDELGALRNQLVHNVSNVTFAFDTFISGLDEGRRSKWEDRVLFLIGASGAGQRQRARAWLDRNPKLALWGHSMALLTHLFAHKSRMHHERGIEDLKRRIGEDFLAMSPKSSPEAEDGAV